LDAALSLTRVDVKTCGMTRSEGDDNWFTHAKEARERGRYRAKAAQLRSDDEVKKGRAAKNIGSERRPRLLQKRGGRAE